MSTADDTSAAEPRARVVRERLEFDTIIVVGGGCYGSYYVRQLLRAHRAGAARWTELVVVDRDANCRVAQLTENERPPALRLRTTTWEEFFAEYLNAAAPDTRDAIVPSPLMPHLFAGWIVSRAKKRWPARHVTITPVGDVTGMPWQRSGDDATHFVSFADWMCPINCVEPATCPHTRGPRDWSMPVSIRKHAAPDSAHVFQCIHRTHGVGMIDVRDIIAADASITERGAQGELEFLVGTASHCHGAMQRISVSG